MRNGPITVSRLESHMKNQQTMIQKLSDHVNSCSIGNSSSIKSICSGTRNLRSALARINYDSRILKPGESFGNPSTPKRIAHILLEHISETP
jgi:hypothetical protein